MQHAMDRDYLNSCPEEERREILRAVCHASRWIDQLSGLAPYQSLDDLRQKSAQVWARCDEEDWREALAGHPRIGERAQGQDLASRWSRGEQAAAATPDEAVQRELRDRQAAYEEKFGFLFLICATGLSSQQILAALNQRMQNSPESELPIVAEELAKIIDLRLEKLLQP